MAERLHLDVPGHAQTFRIMNSIERFDLVQNRERDVDRWKKRGRPNAAISKGISCVPCKEKYLLGEACYTSLPAHTYCLQGLDTYLA